MTQRQVDGIDVEMSKCGLHECFLSFIGRKRGRLEAKGKETVPSQDRLFSQLAFPRLFFLVVFARALGDPRRSKVDLWNEGRSTTVSMYGRQGNRTGRHKGRK